MKLKTALLAALCCSAQLMQAQEEAPDAKNFVKLNLAGIFVKNYSVQAERVLAKKFSVALSYRTMSKSDLPFKQTIINAVDDDPDAVQLLQTMQVSNMAITPELRYYVGRGYGQGFYIAPFYRYAKFDASDMKVEYTGGLPQTRSLLLAGTSKAHTGGIMIGAQWVVAKHLCIDWWILGPHVGSAKGEINGTPNQPLNSIEQQELRNKLEEMDFPLTDKTVSVTANAVRINTNGTWAGLRAGLSIGFGF